MRRPKHFLNTILGVVIAAGCSNVPSQPTQEPANASLSGFVNGLVIGNCTNAPRFELSKPVGPEGGKLQMGPHTLDIPAGALSETVVITATSSGSKGNAVTFGPEGLRFKTFARLTLSTANCSGLGPFRLPFVVYTDDLLNILEREPSIPNLHAKRTTGLITHFSRYAIAY